jgi:hypothetical protein
MRSSSINLYRLAIMLMIALSFFLPSQAKAFIDPPSQQATIITALRSLLTQLNNLLSPQTTEAQTAAPTCYIDIPSTAQPDTYFQIGWYGANATHMAFQSTGNSFYSASDTLSPDTGDFYYIVAGTTTTKMKATSGSGTISFCFDQDPSLSGSYSQCLDRTPHVVCSQTVTIIDTQAPSVPADLAVSVISSTQINLSWSASSDNTAVTGYRIYRNGDDIFTSNSTTYQSTGLIAKTSYSYAVAAYDAAGNVSDRSSSVTVSTPATPTATSPYATPPTGVQTFTIYPTPAATTATTTNVVQIVNVTPQAPAINTVDPSTLVEPIKAKLTTLSQRITADAALINLNTYLAELQLISAEINLVQVTLKNTGMTSSEKFTRILQTGVTDPEVRVLQETLKSLGYYAGPVTGYFHPLTEQAVKLFQKAHNIPQDGVVNPLTIYELNLLYK